MGLSHLAFFSVSNGSAAKARSVIGQGFEIDRNVTKTEGGKAAGVVRVAGKRPLEQAPPR